jgi:hypothetical protein
MQIVALLGVSVVNSGITALGLRQSGQLLSQSLD